MCLAVPGQILEIDGTMATVNVAGVKRRISLDLVEDVAQGEYVLVHVGFALKKVNEQEATETLATLQACFSEDMWRDE